MTEFFFQASLSNLLVSSGLAVIAWAVTRSGRSPMIAHFLWLLVLVKLVTPPVFQVPVEGLPSFEGAALEFPQQEFPQQEFPQQEFAAPVTGAGELSPASFDGLASEGATGNGSFMAELKPLAGLPGLGLLWIVGSAGVLVVSLSRVGRFHRLLLGSSEEAPDDVQEMARSVGQRLGLRRNPSVLTSEARVTPLVWWVGGPVRLVLPRLLTSELSRDELRWVIAHELAHVKRGDHRVRWLEWFACVAFWWNPVAWWARRELRHQEEVCCDALVLSALAPHPRKYATSLLTAIESLATPGLPVPALASKVTGGGFLERRFR